MPIRAATVTATAATAPLTGRLIRRVMESGI
jgi:hypothetical protein